MSRAASIVESTAVERLIAYRDSHASKGWLALMDYAMRQPNSQYSLSNPNGIKYSHVLLAKKLYDSRAMTESERQQMLTQAGYYKRFYHYCDTAQLPAEYTFEGVTYNLQEVAAEWIKKYKDKYGPNSLVMEAEKPRAVIFGALHPGLQELIDQDAELKAALDRLQEKVNQIHEKQGYDPLLIIREHIIDAAHSWAASPQDPMAAPKTHQSVTRALTLARRIADEHDLDQDIKQTIQSISDKLATAPDKLKYPNASTQAFLSQMRTLLNERFPTDRDDDKLADLCQGWNYLSETKKTELLEANKKLHEVFETYANNTKHHNALYDYVHDHRNTGLKPREWAVMAAGLGLRILPTLPELFMLEVTTRTANMHTRYVTPNIDDEKGHAELYFDFVRSMHKIAPDQPLVDNMQKYDMLLALLRYKKKGINFLNLDEFEQALRNDQNVLAYQRYAAAVVGGSKPEWDGFGSVDASKEGQLADFKQMQNLLEDLPAELSDYADCSLYFRKRMLNEWPKYYANIAELLGMLTRENSTDKGGSYMEAMLRLMQLHLGYQENNSDKIAALLWPYVHVGATGGVEERHAALARAGVFDNIAVAKMQHSGGYAEDLTKAIEEVSGTLGFQGVHYKHYDMLVQAMREVSEKSRDEPVRPRPENHRFASATQRHSAVATVR